MNTNSANSAYEKNEKTVDKYIKAIKKEFIQFQYELILFYTKISENQ